MEESKAIAEQYFYRELRNDSAIWVNDSIYSAFIAANQDGAIGKLYEAEFNMEQAMEFDSVFISLMENIIAQSDAITDSIAELDALADEGNPIPDYDLVRAQLVNTLAFLSQTHSNLLAQQAALRDNRLQDAQLINDLVVPDELPQTNTQTINEIEIQFLESGGDVNVLRNHYSVILPIAHQCPYAGGQAVDKARTFVAMINDSMLYFDVDICLQSGIYRTATDSVIQKSEVNNIQIIPNPANDRIEIILNGKNEGLCKIEIKNALGAVVLNKIVNCKEQKHTINISEFKQGVYSVKVDVNNNTFVVTKLVITR